MARILILCPTFNHADAIYMSIASVRAQDFSDWRMVIIGDGTSKKTSAIAAALAGEDERITYASFPKSARYGEEYRDSFVRESDAELVCHLSDDDLWAPNHLDTMLALTKHGDWVCQAPIRIAKTGHVDWWPINHSTRQVRRAVAAFFGLSVGLNYAAYRTSAYRQLPKGWTSAPKELGPSDRFNWSKFMSDDSIVVASQAVTTALKFPSRTPDRFASDPETRAAELGPWLARIARPGFIDAFRKQGSVEQRFRALFALHGCWQINDLDAAFAQCGMRAVGQDVRPMPARGESLMAVPLTPKQIDEARAALETVQKTAPLLEGSPDANNWEDTLGKHTVSWLEALFGFGLQDFPTAEKIYHAFREQLSEEPHFWTTWFVLAMEAQQYQRASDLLDSMRAIFPNAAWTDLLDDRLRLCV